jgi:hypothetical protein
VRRIPNAFWVIAAMIWIAIPISASGNSPRSLTQDGLEQFARLENGTRVIHLPRGTYTLPGTLYLSSGTVLEGEGEGTLLRPEEFFKGARLVTNADPRNGNTDITVRSLAIEVEAIKFPGDSPGILRFEKVRNLNLKDLTLRLRSQFYGIDLASHCQDALVEGCSIVNEGEGGCIMVRNRDASPERPTRNVRVLRNRLGSGKVDEPLAVFGWLGLVQDVEVRENQVDAIGASFGISAYGIDTPGHTGSLVRVRIEANEIRGGKIGAIGVKGGAREVDIVNNRISSPEGDGIFLHTGGRGLPSVREVRVRGNSISKAGRHGIFATGQAVTVEKNEIRDCRKIGIYVGNSVSVVRNHIENSSPGILVEGTRDRIVRENRTRNAPIRVIGGDRSGISENVEE